MELLRHFLCSSHKNDEDSILPHADLLEQSGSGLNNNEMSRQGRMRGIEQSTRGDPAKTELPEKRPAKIKTLKGIFGKPKMKLPSIRRSSKSPTDTFDPIINILPKPEVILTFEENIQQQHFSSAGQQLIHLEESVFRNDMGKEENVKKEKLKRDYEALLRQIWLAVEASLTFSSEELKVVKSAVSCIQQEEEQDQRWKEEPGAVAPDWRPMQCRRKHDALLQQMVKKRMEETEDLSRADKLSSSLKRDICKMGIRMRDDLLKVVQELNKCYPEEFDICNTYARLYHEAFTEHLMKITEYELDLEDCTYLLSWVNDHYPNDILKHKTLKEIINCQSLGPLLPVEVTEPLEEQYLSDKKAYLETCISNALREEEKTWQSGALPQLSDKHYTSYIAIDVIQCVDKTLSNARVVLGGPYKARSIMCQLKCFLISYKKSLEEFIKGKCGNTKEVVKANLASLEQFKDYIGSCSDFFTDEMRTCCLSIVSSMKECCYLYLSNIIHTDLKVRYRKLGTHAWLTGNSNVLKEVMEGIRVHIEKCRDLKASCLEELVGRLHTEVMVEYVKRLLKRKLKLKDKIQQETASKLLYEDSRKLHTLFTEEGSKEEWLSGVLPKIAEVLKIQDPSMIQLEIVTLAQDFPDLSEHNVSELLHLKSNLTTLDIKRIKESLMENRQAVISQNSRTFFSRIPINWISKIM